MTDPIDDLLMLAMSGITVVPNFIPSCGDRVKINPNFVKQWSRCSGTGVPMPAHQNEPNAGKLLALSPAVLTVWRLTANHPDPLQALILIELKESPFGIWLDPQGRYDDCQRCCTEYSIDPCPFKNGMGEPFFVLDGMSIGDLKAKNTAPGATHCAKCGTPLRNVGWHSMQHCPRCEP